MLKNYDANSAGEGNIRNSRSLLKWGMFVSAFFLLVILAQATNVIDLSDRVQSFSFVYVVTTAVFLKLYRRGQPLDFFSPGVGLVVLLFLYSISSALYAETMGVTAHNDPVGDDVLAIYYQSCVAGLFGLSIGMLCAQRIATPFTRRLPSQLLLENDEFYKKLFLAALVLGLVFSPKIVPWFNFLNVPSYAERALAMRLERMEDAAAGVVETMFVNLPITLILCLATLFIFKKRKPLYVMAGSTIILSYVVRNTMAGWRGQVMAAVMIPAVFYHYRVRKIKAPAALLSGVVVYLFINVMSFVRSTSNIAEMYSLVQAALQSGNTKFLSLTSSSELLVGTNLLRLISGIRDHEASFTYGLSVISEFLVFIPKVLFPSRPLPLSELFVSTFYPGELEEGGGLGFFMLQEGYWACGVLGVFVLTFLYGWCVQSIYQWIQKNLHYDMAPLVYAVIYNALVLAAVRSGLFGNFKNVLMGIIPFLVVMYLPTVDLRNLFTSRKKGPSEA